MNIYISGISGTGMGPLALMAKEAGLTVFGSDRSAGQIAEELAKNEIEVNYGEQDANFLRKKVEEEGVDWFVHTSALSADHPELVLAQELGLKISKRDELIGFLVEKLGLKMIAVAGTHGKTTTTSMIIYAGLKLGLPISYLVGTTLGFAQSGKYAPGSKFFIYEADEYDRNFLHFRPYVSVITSVSYDHPDIYPTKAEYEAAFVQFEGQSQNVIKDILADPLISLAGAARRIDASMAKMALLKMQPDVDEQKVVEALNDFPGVGRRFERIVAGLYSDYAHHPEEIAATVDVAKDEMKRLGRNGLMVIYQPHQNTRQHEVFAGYKDAFLGVDKLYWLPTYLTRENPDLRVIEPGDFIDSLSNSEIGEGANLDEKLADCIKKALAENQLVLLMTAGPADTWLRENFKA